MPFIINVICLAPFYFQKKEFKIQYISDQMLDKSNFLLMSNQLFLVIMVIQIVIYIIFIRKIIRKHQMDIKDTFSSIDKINLSWINHFITFFLILSAVIIFILLFSKFFFHYNYMYKIIPVIVVISLYSIAYRGIVQPQIFRQSTTDKDKELKKYEKSALTEEESDKYYDQLNIFMKNNKPFLDQELTLTDLSEQVEIPFRYLSQVINEKTGQNFYFFINQYRLEEVKKYLTDPAKKNQSVLEMAFDAGFNSKATFNAIFKQATNLTPSQYRKKNS
jgi:AraC-like DNA-binding protein